MPVDQWNMIVWLQTHPLLAALVFYFCCIYLHHAKGSMHLVMDIRPVLVKDRYVNIHVLLG